MNLHIKQLVSLSQIDKEIDAFEPQIEEARYKLEAALAKKQSIDSDVENLTKEIKDEQIKKQKNEMHLQDLSKKLSDNSKKSGEIKTEREMKSLQLEEEIAKEQVTFANEEIDRLERIIDLKTEQVEAAKKSLIDLEANLTSVREEVDAKLEVINNSRQDVFMKKEKLISEMNQKGLAFYQKIRRWAKNSTVVAVEDQACMGCNMLISDKIYADVIRAEEITTCPHCGRILYLEIQE
ncbi:zinc ribbon domain-containing protein [Sulfurimonas sp.]|uniref:zinc ribbon domain-containing protein n=1 Tax=Sulfurimonas sp. TaxID=2022749 RepID=UPI0025F4DA82|nr:zinc ribbon domain-containing protein [Sulfurimonas sp.]MDD5157422.1 zinc ribbon domain-containing protein [Sulfurimonas sp.]